MVWADFTLEEFACNCCGENFIKASFIDQLQRLRTEAGFQFIINSGYRCPKHNRRVSSTGLSGPHTTGRAADVKVSGSQAYQLIALALEHGFTGIGIKQGGDWSQRFVHLDNLEDSEDRSRPRVWTY